MLWIETEVIDFFIQLIFRLKQYKNAKIANFVYYGKTLLFWCSSRVNLISSFVEAET